MGVLGWLDLPLGSEIYIGFAILFSVLAIMCIGLQPSAALQRGSIPMACAVVASISRLLMFFLFLVTYNPHPTNTIGGIEGRYFITMAILMSYAIFGRPLRSAELRIGLVLVSLMLLLAIVGMVPR